MPAVRPDARRHSPVGYERGMSMTLQKGGNVSLAKAAPGLRSVLIGLGWDARTTRGVEFDLDASAFLLTASDRVPADEYFIFYNNLTSPDGSVEHTGDNRTGEGEGDDESIRVELAEVPAEVVRIVVVVSIHEAIERGQNFGQVRNAFIRVVDADTEVEVARYDLSEDASVETTMIFGELYRRDGDWKFRAVGQGYSSGLAGIATRLRRPPRVTPAAPGRVRGRRRRRRPPRRPARRAASGSAPTPTPSRCRMTSPSSRSATWCTAGRTRRASSRSSGPSSRPDGGCSWSATTRRSTYANPRSAGPSASTTPRR